MTKPPPFDTAKLLETDLFFQDQYDPEAEVVEVEGIVSDEGQSVIADRVTNTNPDGTTWTQPRQTHNFTLAVWRRVGGPIHERELRILRAADPAQEPEEVEFFPAELAIRFYALLSKDETRGVFARMITVLPT